MQHFFLPFNVGFAAKRFDSLPILIHIVLSHCVQFDYQIFIGFVPCV